MGGQFYKTLVQKSDKFCRFGSFPPSRGRLTFASLLFRAGRPDGLTFFVRAPIRVSETGLSRLRKKVKAAPQG